MSASASTGLHAGCHIVLTGAGCSGKTSTIAAVADLLRAQGYRVLIMPEAATELMTQLGISFGDLDPVAYQEVQTELAARQRDSRWHAARLCRSGVVDVVLYDRAELDAYPYTEPGTLEAVLATQNETVTDAIEGYDAVFYLHAAPADAGAYETESNPVRYESEELARQRGEALRVAWSVHPRFCEVSYRESIDGKIGFVTHSVTHLLANRPAPVGP